jgi:hypothetical protein
MYIPEEFLSASLASSALELDWQSHTNLLSVHEFVKKGLSSSLMQQCRLQRSWLSH